MRRRWLPILAALALVPAADAAAAKKKAPPQPQSVFTSTCPMPAKGVCTEKGKGWLCTMACSEKEVCAVDVYCFQNAAGLTKRICMVPSGPADCCFLQLGGKTQGWCLNASYDVAPLK